MADENDPDRPADPSPSPGALPTDKPLEATPEDTPESAIADADPEEALDPLAEAAKAAIAALQAQMEQPSAEPPADPTPPPPKAEQSVPEDTTTPQFFQAAEPVEPVVAELDQAVTAESPGESEQPALAEPTSSATAFAPPETLASPPKDAAPAVETGPLTFAPEAAPRVAEVAPALPGTVVSEVQEDAPTPAPQEFSEAPAPAAPEPSPVALLEHAEDEAARVDSEVAEALVEQAADFVAPEAPPVEAPPPLVADLIDPAAPESMFEPETPASHQPSITEPAPPEVHPSPLADTTETAPAENIFRRVRQGRTRLKLRQPKTFSSPRFQSRGSPQCWNRRLPRKRRPQRPRKLLRPPMRRTSYRKRRQRQANRPRKKSSSTRQSRCSSQL